MSVIDLELMKCRKQDHHLDKLNISVTFDFYFSGSYFLTRSLGMLTIVLYFHYKLYEGHHRGEVYVSSE